MECLANGAAVARRLVDIAFSLVRAGSAARRALCYTANRIAVQETLLLDSKTVCCTAIAVARQQKRLLDNNQRCCATECFPLQQSRFARAREGSNPTEDSSTRLII